MIICNSCGTPLNETLRFCSECGTPAPGQAETLRYDSSGVPPSVGHPGVATPASSRPGAPDYPPVVAPPSPANYAPDLTPRAAPAPGVGAKIALVVVGVLIIAAIAITAVLFALSGFRDAAASPDSVAASLQSAITNGRLVTGSSDDAYTYFFRLQKIDPRHKLLTEVKPRVLPQIRALGDAVFLKRVEFSLEIIDEQEWTRAMRAYEWAHTLEQNDKGIEARWRYAAAHVARLQARRDEAQNGLYDATQLDPSWAPPQNDLGYSYVLSRRYSEAIPFYQRAINLQSNWDIPYNNMGTVYYYLKNFDAAEAWYNKTVQVNSKWATPHAWLGSVYENKKSNAAAIQELQTALNLYNPNRDRFITADIENKINALKSKP